jgi:hypothetical protein
MIELRVLRPSHAMNLYRRNGFVRTDRSHLTRRLSRA